MSMDSSQDKSSLCIYCNGWKQHPKMTTEHIWPQALGGKNCPPCFITAQVCKRCNDTAGQWVDRAYLRNFFSSSERSRTAIEFLDPKKPSAVPLVYMGIDKDFPCQINEVCERWLGPSGESIYHIHEADDDRWSTLAGGDFIKRKKNPGRVYFSLTGHSMYWFWIAIASIVKAFPGARVRSLTVLENFPSSIPILQINEGPLSQDDANETNWILNRSSSSHQTDMTINIGYADRFLAKLALGLAHTILGPAATFSPYGDQLRQMFWSRDIEKRSDIGVHGTGPWDNSEIDGIKQFITFPGVWSVFLTRVSNCFSFILGTPSGRIMSMVMSNDPTLWKSEYLDAHIGGALYCIVPQRDRVFGPIPMNQVLAHHLGNKLQPELQMLEGLRTGLSALPDRERATDVKAT